MDLLKLVFTLIIIAILTGCTTAIKFKEENLRDYADTCSRPKALGFIKNNETYIVYNINCFFSGDVELEAQATEGKVLFVR